MKSKTSDSFLSRIRKRLGLRAAGEIRLDRDDLAGIFNPHYARAADVCHLIGYAACALLIVFLLGAVLLNIGDVTYENLYYFVKDFGAVVSTDDFGASPVIYSYAEDRTYAGYKGGIVTSGGGVVTVFSATGRKTAGFYTGYSNPRVCTSSKYILVFDLGGREYSIYNSFVRLHTGALDNPILAAAICDSGSFALLSSEGEYKSVIYRYNSRFEKSAAYYYSDYVISMSLSADGRYLIVSPVGTNRASLSSRLLLYEERSEEPQLLDWDIPGLVLTCGVENESSLSGETIFYHYATADSILVGGWGDVPQKIALEGAELVCLDSDREGLAALLADKDGYVLHIIPYKGVPATVRLDEKALKISKYENMVFILFPEKAARYNIGNKELKTLSCDPGAEDIVVSSLSYIYITYASRAVSVGFD